MELEYAPTLTIIAISREFGSGGHEIAEQIAKDLKLNFYDRNMLDEIAKEKNIQIGYLEKYEEKPTFYTYKRKFFYFFRLPA